MAIAAASPLCTWLLAACISRAVVGYADDKSMSSGSLGRPSGRKLRRRNASSKLLAGTSWSTNTPHESGYLTGEGLAAFCGSGISGLGSCFAFEGCPEYANLKHEPIFGDMSFFGSGLRGLRMKPVRAARRLVKVGAGKPSAVTAQPVQPVKESSETKKTSTKPRRVVVTGMGLVSSLGHDANTYYDNLLAGKSGVSEIENFDCKQFPTRIASEIKSFSTDGWVAAKFARRMDKFMLYMLTAGKKAVVDAGITDQVMKDLDKTKCGVLIGSAMGGMQIFNDAVEALRVSYRKMNPFCVPFATTNMGSAMLAMDLGWMGPNYSISTACATSNFCILSAANHIIRGEVDIMLAGGSDAAVIPIGLGGFVACKALSQRNHDPMRASRPWDADRDGFVMGEGAGVLLLEELEHAKSRGAEIYAEFLGGSFSCDAHHTTEPHPEGAGVLLCIENALAQSGVSRKDVNYINAHATSTKAGDLQEYKALMRCFGDNPELKINSTKSMIGHLLGAAGAVEAIATIQGSLGSMNYHGHPTAEYAGIVVVVWHAYVVPNFSDVFEQVTMIVFELNNLLRLSMSASPTTMQAIRTGWVHPTINLENPESTVDMNKIVGGEKQRLDIKVALSNSFGFGGQNSSILLAPYVEDEPSL